jgi:hypothetical protein
VRARPISPASLIEELAERITAVRPSSWARVAVDGAPAARPEALADALHDPLRLRGRAVLRVSAADFLRPASLRLEFGRDDPDVYYTEWLDTGGLNREVLAPLEPGGSGRVLPALWDSAIDRSARADYVRLPERGVLLLDGTLLLGRGLPLDYVVHLAMAPPALARRTAPEEQWTLPAYERYETEVAPTRVADVAVRIDDPRHPALIESNSPTV